MDNDHYEALLARWRERYDSMQKTTAPLREQIDSLTAALKEKESPFRKEMGEIEGEIKIRTLVRASSHKADGVQVLYRKSYQRVAYTVDTVDIVLGVLRDMLPETARMLEGARKVTSVSHSVTIKAVDKEE